MTARGKYSWQPALNSNLAQAVKAQRGVEIYLYSFFNLALDGEGVQRHAPATAEIQTLYPFREGWVELRAGLDDWGKIRSPQYSIPGPSSQ
jgi:hypothetical protein